MLPIRVARTALLALMTLAPALGQELEHGSYEERSFRSEALDRDVEYGVYMPSGEHESLPLIVWLHGMREDHLRFERRGGAEVLDRLVGQGAIPPCVLVSPNGDRYGFWIDGKESGRYESMVTKDLLNHVTDKLPLSSDRSHRAIAGVSMGGLGALKIAFRDPDRFGAVSAHSAALFPPNPSNLSKRFQRVYDSWGRRIGLDRIFGRPIDTAVWRANNPIAMAKDGEAGPLKRLAIRFDAGTRDRYGFHTPCQQLHELLKSRGIEHEWNSLKGVGHSWGSGSMPERLEAGLRFIAKHWKDAKKGGDR